MKKSLLWILPLALLSIISCSTKDEEPEEGDTIIYQPAPAPKEDDPDQVKIKVGPDGIEYENKKDDKEVDVEIKSPN